jgi:hypothetical protein
MALSSMGRRFKGVSFAVPPVVTFQGATHVGGGPGNAVSGTYTIPNNAVVVVGGYGRIGGGTGAPNTLAVTVGSTSLTLQPQTVIDRGYAFQTGFSSGVVSPGGSQTVQLTTGSANNGQVRGFWVWTLENLINTSPKTTSSQFNENLVDGTPPTAAAVAAGDYGFAICEFVNLTGQDWQQSTPLPTHDPTTSSAYVDTAYGIAYAADWFNLSAGTLTAKTSSNVSSCQKALITFGTT